MRRPAKKSSGAAGLFVLLGILTILGVTFAAGLYAGRIWATRPERPAVAASTVATTSTEREPGRRAGEARAARVPDPGPRLTFYHELTAPLTAPPPPPKPGKATPPPPLTTRARTDTASPETLAASRDVAASLPTRTSATSSGSAPIATDGTRYTVQVGAYKARPPAEALRATLTAAGHEARGVETDAPNGVRFRVQVGDFVSRDAAREAASRLSGPTFVTTR
jgi:cell division protein FtsN